MKKVRALKTNILKSFKTFSDCLEKIQNRPEFSEIQNRNPSLPPLKLADLREISIGTTTTMAGLTFLGLGPVLGGVIIAFLGSKLSAQADEAYAEAQKIKTEAEKICKRLRGITSTANDFYHVLDNVYSVYDNYLKKLTTLVKYKTDWNTYSDKEQKMVEICTLLVGLLYKMCKVPLIKKDCLGEQDANTVEVKNSIHEAEIILAPIPAEELKCSSNNTLTYNKKENTMLKSKDFIQVLEKMCNTMEFPFEEFCDKCGFSLPLFLENKIEILPSHKMLAAEVLNLPVGMVSIAAEAHNPNRLDDMAEKAKKAIQIQFIAEHEEEFEALKNEKGQAESSEIEQEILNAHEEELESMYAEALEEIEENFPSTEKLISIEKLIHRILNENNEEINTLFWDKYDEREEEDLEAAIHDYNNNEFLKNIFSIRDIIITADMAKIVEILNEMEETFHKDQPSSARNRRIR